MRSWLLILIGFLLFLGVKSQYFHESLDLNYNLRSTLIEDQKAKIGFRTYSNINFENTIPNIFDNIQLLSRFKFANTSSRFVNNAEFGAEITSFISGSNQIAEQFKKPPMLIQLYNDNGHNFVITPGLQYIKNWIFNDTIDSRLQFGLGLRYNIVGNPEMFTKSYPFGYDLSLQFNIKYFSVQFMHAANTIYNSFTFRTADLNEFVNSNKKRISIPVEFENLTFLTFSLGNAYFKVPSENDKLLYYLYFSMRRLFPSNKEYRSNLSFKNLDYIFGISLRYKQWLFNPEYGTHRSDNGPEAMKGNSYSFLLGYAFRNVSVKLGYAHIVYYELATDVYSLKNNDHINLDKIIFAIDYSF